MKQFYTLLLTHFKEIIREPSVIFWGIVFPILMAWGLGIAFTQKPETNADIVFIANLQKSDVVPDYLKAKLKLDKKNLKGQTCYQFKHTDEKTGKITLNFFPKTWDEANTMLKKGETAIVLDIKNGEPAFYFDRMNSEAQLLFTQLTGLIEKGPEYFSEQNKNAQPLTIAGTRYVDFLIPGLLGMGIMMSCMWGLSYSLIEKRSKKLLRRMVATPMRKTIFLTSLFTARFTMNLVEAIILVLFAHFYFGLSVQGNISALILLFIAGNAAFSGLAVLISSRTGNPEVGNGLINAIVTPMMVLSGVFFSYHSFPEWLIYIIKPLPLTMLNDGVRAVFNEGAGFAETLLPTLILFVEGFVFFIAGLKLFKWY
jgi:ABC-type multidrug transport system permease subunit